jgi:hypothetical protein
MFGSTFDFIVGILGFFINRIAQMHALYFVTTILIDQLVSH